MKKKIIRKHWTEYKFDKTMYGTWRIIFKGQKFYGFGIYLLDGTDAWLDISQATPNEIKMYKKYLKLRGFEPLDLRKRGSKNLLKEGK